ncbi:hypothetical protein RUM43_010973 [Polyplax serrata]|uniref:Uncharacterized protein n=1 Tax=Polyplax serrata TaxID=468196 RepID=A0AAN8P4B6_POLSC
MEFTAQKTPNLSMLEPPVPDVTVISLTSPASNAFQEWNKDVDETNKWHSTDGPTCPSNNASPQVFSPTENTEEAEEALGCVAELPAPAPAPEPTHSETTITSLHSLTTKVTIARKASQTWKGFSLKKQLNRVKKTPLLPNREKNSSSAGPTENLSPSEEPATSEPHHKESEVPEDDWTVLENSSQRSSSDKYSENVVRTSEDGGYDDAKWDDPKSGRLNRPVDLPLFDSEGRPVRPPRLHQTGQKKKSVPERDGGGKRDSRLLSVPNVKHQKQEQVSFRDLRRKQQPTGTQPSFGNLLIRHFSKWRLSHPRLSGVPRTFRSLLCSHCLTHTRDYGDDDDDDDDGDDYKDDDKWLGQHENGFFR